jgi:UDP-glucose 4-epimerase
MGYHRVLVTGGAGFIGSHLTDALLQSGIAVTVLDDLSTGHRGNLTDSLKQDGLDIVEGDVRDQGLLQRVLRGVDAVFHLAAVVSVPYSVERPQETFAVNREGTRRLLEACTRGDVHRIIYTSTCAVYGEPRYLPIDEGHPTQPLSPYAQSKLEAEELCLAFHQSQGLAVTILRLFNVYGPRQGSGPYSGVITQFIHRLAEGQAPVIFGDGSQTRDFVHVQDVVHAFTQALHRPEAVGRVFNVATGTPTSLSHLAQVMIQLFQAGDMHPEYAAPRTGDIQHSHANIHAAQQYLGFHPHTTLEAGLSSLIQSSWSPARSTSPQS